MKLDKILPSLHTAAEVSSQEDSMAKMVAPRPPTVGEELRIDVSLFSFWFILFEMQKNKIFAMLELVMIPALCSIELLQQKSATQRKFYSSNAEG